MEKTPLMKLNLCSPLFYNKIIQENTNLPADLPKNEEFLYNYQLNPQQSQSIEPEKNQFLEVLLYTGRKIHNNEQTDNSQMVSLPQGYYLFVQERSNRALNQDEWLDLAIEQQLDGLWERYKLGNLLYVRFLHEDGAVVTQVFRVCLP